MPGTCTTQRGLTLALGRKTRLGSTARLKGDSFPRALWISGSAGAARVLHDFPFGWAPLAPCRSWQPDRRRWLSGIWSSVWRAPTGSPSDARAGCCRALVVRSARM